MTHEGREGINIGKRYTIAEKYIWHLVRSLNTYLTRKYYGQPHRPLWFFLLTYFSHSSKYKWPLCIPFSWSASCKLWISRVSIFLVLSVNFRFWWAVSQTYYSSYVSFCSHIQFYYLYIVSYCVTFNII